MNRSGSSATTRRTLLGMGITSAVAAGYDAVSAPAAAAEPGQWVSSGEVGGACNVKDYGAAGNGVADDAGPIQAAINAAQTSGQTLFFPAGTYKVLTTLNVTQGIKMVGESYRKTIIQSATVDVLKISHYGHTLSNLHLRAQAGGGHAVLVPPGHALSQSQFVMCQLTSQNSAKSAFYYSSVGATGGGVFDVHWLDCYFLHTTTSTVPCFSVYGDNNIFSANRFTRCRAQQGGSAPAFSVVADVAGIYNYNNVWDTINFESTNGGGIHLSSAFSTGLHNLGFFDMGKITADLVWCGRTSGSPARPQSRNTTIVNYHRSGGALTAGIADVRFASGGNAGSSLITGIGGPSGAGVTVDLGLKAGYAVVVGYDPNNVAILNATTSTVLLAGQTGVTTGRVTFTPRKGATRPFDSSGSGTPERLVTAPVGSTWRRSDGGPGTCFYVKESGSGNSGWVAK